MSLSPNNLESRQRELRDQEYDNAVMIDQIDERDGDNNNSPSDVQRTHGSTLSTYLASNYAMNSVRNAIGGAGSALKPPVFKQKAKDEIPIE